MLIYTFQQFTRGVLTVTIGSLIGLGFQDGGARLVFDPVQNSDEDVYQCVATNDVGMATDYIALLVNGT